MPVSLSNCYICKNTWLGKGPLCDDCLNHFTAAAQSKCSFCGGSHDDADCLAAALAAQQRKQNAYKSAYSSYRATYNYNMATKTPRRSKPFMRYNAIYDQQMSPPLRFCCECNQRATIETKAGSICTNCKALTRNPCRDCDSTSTHGLSGDGTQFIECNDCQFIE